MAKYSGPVCRLCRREGIKLFLKGVRCYTDRCPVVKRPFPPGQHGKGRRFKLSDYGVQLRENDLTPRELLALAKECKAIAHAGGARFIVNHNLDVALAAEADGVHLGWRSLPVREVRRVAPKGFLIGASTHSVGAAARVAEESVDYVFLGPIFRTPSKEGLIKPLGVEAIRTVKQTAKVPVIAIGGIKAENVREVIAAGADGIAVISAIMAASDPREAAQELMGGIRSKM